MSHLFETKLACKNSAFIEASALVEDKIKQLRANTPNLPFEKTKLAEVEIKDRKSTRLNSSHRL